MNAARRATLAHRIGVCDRAAERLSALDDPEVASVLADIVRLRGGLQLELDAIATGRSGSAARAVEHD